MTQIQKKFLVGLIIAFFIASFVFFSILFKAVFAQEYTEDNPLIMEDGVELTGDILDITPHETSRFGQLENDPTGWKEVGHVDNRRLYINVNKIEKASIFRHVYAMFEFTDGAKIVPGHATGVLRVVSEATIDCSSGLTQPLVDYYVDKDWVIKTQTVYQNGQGRSFARREGSIAWALKEVSCNGAKIEDVRIGRTS